MLERETEFMVLMTSSSSSDAWLTFSCWKRLANNFFCLLAGSCSPPTRSMLSCTLALDTKGRVSATAAISSVNITML